MDRNSYERILAIAVEEATKLTNTLRPDRNNDSEWDKFHDQHFGNVLAYIDEHTDLGWVEASEISEICSEVESDIRHGDILGL